MLLISRVQPLPALSDLLARMATAPVAGAEATLNQPPMEKAGVSSEGLSAMETDALVPLNSIAWPTIPRAHARRRTTPATGGALPPFKRERLTPMKLRSN